MLAQSGQRALASAPRRFLRVCWVSLLLSLPLLPMASLAEAEVRVVTAQGEYRMGDRDTREDAVRMATESAKRNALEQVATYLESITVVDGMDVTKDEIRTYTAGLVLVLEFFVFREVVVVRHGCPSAGRQPRGRGPGHAHRPQPHARHPHARAGCGA